MILDAMDYIGRENLEEVALSWHLPIKGNYVYVKLDGTYCILNEKRALFNSKYCAMDYYSGLVSMNKPIASKLITSNNYLSFFCKNVEKLSDQNIDDYFLKLGLPDELIWYKEWIKKNIRTIYNNCGKKYSVKIFLLYPFEKYRELGMEYWRKKSLSQSSSTRKINKTKGYPIGCSYSEKKPYSMNRRPYLIEEQEGLERKFFYDILKGLAMRGYMLLYVGKNLFYPLKNGEIPNIHIKGAVLFVFRIEKGIAVIKEMDSVASFSPWLR